MSSKFVNATSLNFRSSPEVSATNQLGTVFLGQQLSDVVPSGTHGWVSCSAEIDGSVKSGFVSERFLRDPLTTNREALLRQVHHEWMRFRRGTGKENVAPFSGFVGEMWKAIGLEQLDGTDRDVPWSAAAISFMVRNAGGAYAGFRFAAAHSKFTHHAINARLRDDRTVPFWGYRLHEVRPQPGDIICRDNPTHGADVDFDHAQRHDSFRSHTDIVVRIDSDRQKLVAIGGNVSHSVKIAEYDLSPGDFADDTNHTYAILKNITDGVPSA